MALTDCPECKHRVSEHALACPSCGFPLKGQSGWSRQDVTRIAGIAGAAWIIPQVVRWLIGAAIFLGLMYFVFVGSRG